MSVEAVLVVISRSYSNTLWLARFDIAPQQNLALFVATNSADLELHHSITYQTTTQLLEALSVRASAAFGL